MRGWRLGVFLGIALLVWYWRYISGVDNQLKTGQQVEIIGNVTSQPIAKTDKYTGEEYQWVWISVGSETFGFRADRWGSYQYGDQLKITGVINRMNESNLENSQSASLSIIDSLTSRTWVISHPEIIETKTHSQSKIIKHIRSSILSLFRTALPRDEAGLLSGMVLGTKGELSSDFKQALQNTGTLHVVVASGFNVMLVGGTLVSLLILWFRRQVAVVLALIGVWVYVGLAGFDAPVVRAGIMGSLAFISIITGRVRDAGWLLIITTIIMLWWKPAWLWDVGFQLSVAATAGLIWIEPRLKTNSHNSRHSKQKSHDIPGQSTLGRPATHKSLTSSITAIDMSKSFLFDITKIFAPILGESLRTTIAAQLAVTPILLIAFGQLSLLSPLVNALVLWVVPVITGAGMLVGLISLLSPAFLMPLFVSALWLIYPLLKYFTSIVSIFGQQGTIPIQTGWVFAIVWYLGLVVFLIRK